MVKVILLSERFGNNIFTRNTISALFDEVNEMKDAEIKLDFSEVKFISRSCADEYLKRKQESKKKIIEVNLLNEVCSMFNAVKSQYKKAGFSISFDICNIRDKKLVAV